MSADRPINADVPERDEAEEEAPETDAGKASPASESSPGPAPSSPSASELASKPGGPAEKRARAEGSEPGPEPRRRRPRVPGALKLIAGLVIVAVGFIVLVLVAGGGGGPGEDTTAVEAPAATPLIDAPSDSEDEGGGGGGTADSGAGLGFPLVATDNTTRLGGAAPAEVAAAAALSVFPSITPEQRPAAVALVDESEWPTAVAAAALMAPPVRAPLLYTAEEAMPPATEAALAALSPAGSDATKGTGEFVFGEADPAVPEDAPATKRIRSEAGAVANVADIAILRDELAGSPPAAVLVAPLEDPGFAAPAAAYAARSGDPVLFAERDALPEPTAATLKRHTKVPVYVLGPKSAISDDVLAEIGKLGPRVTRVAGSSPVRNAIAFAKFADGGFGWGVTDPGHGFVLAREDAPLAAAAASPLSAAGTWGPLLLTDDAATLPKELRSYFLDVKPGYTDNPTRAFYNHIWVVGDESAIDVGQQAEVNELAELAKIGGGE